MQGLLVIAVLFVLSGCSGKEDNVSFSVRQMPYSDRVSLVMDFRTGLGHEADSVAGRTAYVLSAALGSGSGKYSAEEMDRFFSEAGICYSIEADWENTRIRWSFPAMKQSESWSLISRRLLYPNFASSVVDDVLLRDFQSETVEELIPRDIETLIRFRLYGLSAAGMDTGEAGYQHQPGTVAGSTGRRALTAAQMAEYYEQRFSVHNMHISAAGRISQELRESILEDMTQFHSYSGRIELPPAPETLMEEAGMTLLLRESEDRDRNIAVLALPLDIFPYTSAYFDMYLLSRYLGHSAATGGKLFREIVSRRGLAAKVSAALNNRNIDRISGIQLGESIAKQPVLFIVLEGFRSGDLHFIIKLLLGELGRLAEEGLAASELEELLAAVKAEQTLSEQYAEYIAGRRADSRYFASEDLDSEFMDHCSRLKLMDINSTAMKFIDTDRILLYFEGKALRDFLRKALENSRQLPQIPGGMGSELRMENRDISEKQLEIDRILVINQE